MVHTRSARLQCFTHSKAVVRFRVREVGRVFRVVLQFPGKYKRGLNYDLWEKQKYHLPPPSFCY